MAGKKGGTISKMEAVRRAMAELGNDATPTPIQGYVKEKFGIDMSKEHISVCKRDALRQQQARATPEAKGPVPQKSAAQKAPPKKATPKPPARPAAAPPAKQAGSGGKAGGIPLEDILAVRELVGRLGAAPLHTLIDAFAR